MAPPVLYYDGLCGFCDATVQFVLRHDRSRRLHFAPLQGEHAQRLHERHPWLHDVDSLVWADDPGGTGRVLVRSDAVLRVARYLGFPWALAAIARVVPRRWRDRMYDAIARQRRRVRPLPASCEIPPPEVRRRFLR
jgi:predicted DCC family thiol-disulfide oxidoreductase YuxK